MAVHLAGYAVRRRVDRCGLVSLYNRNHYVGVIHKGKDVFIMFDPERLEWVIADTEGRQLRGTPRTRSLRSGSSASWSRTAEENKWPVNGKTSCRDFAAVPHVV